MNINGRVYTYYQVNRVMKRTMDKDGQFLLVPDYEIKSYWIRLVVDERALNGDTLISLYYDHATCEQLHSEFKSDLDLERLPSGKLSTNTLVLTLGAVTYHLLLLVGQEILRDLSPPYTIK
jgi:hypothetical protein